MKHRIDWKESEAENHQMEIILQIWCLLFFILLHSTTVWAYVVLGLNQHQKVVDIKDWFLNLSCC